MNNNIQIYTDGGCSGNPGVGGYGVVILFSNREIKLSGGELYTTNSRMELLAIIKGLEYIRIIKGEEYQNIKYNIEILSDSKYIIDSINKGWLNNWRQDGISVLKDYPKNPDLWLRLIELLEENNISFTWIKGHNGDKYNELCDKIAKIEIKKIKKTY